MKSVVVEKTVDLLSAAADAKDAPRAHAALFFLLRLSTVEDGRTTVLKVVGALSAMARARAAFLLAGHIRYQCSLAFRNLAFSPEAKVHFLAQDGAFEAVLDDLDGGMSVPEADQCRAHAADAIWALIYNCQKVRCDPTSTETEACRPESAGRCAVLMWCVLRRLAGRLGRTCGGNRRSIACSPPSSPSRSVRSAQRCLLSRDADTNMRARFRPSLRTAESDSLLVVFGRRGGEHLCARRARPEREMCAVNDGSQPASVPAVGGCEHGRSAAVRARDELTVRRQRNWSNDTTNESMNDVRRRVGPEGSDSRNRATTSPLRHRVRSSR
eukprot:2154010-Rhodomonas_salina.10